MTTVAMNCPNEECEAEYEVAVLVYGAARRATLESPAEEPEIDVEGPDACAKCGEPLDTIPQTRHAAQQAHDQWIEQALDQQRDNEGRRRRRIGR